MQHRHAPRPLTRSGVRDLLLEQYTNENSREDGRERRLQNGFHGSQFAALAFVDCPPSAAHHVSAVRSSTSDRDSSSPRASLHLAEGVGFEPTVLVRGRQFSRLVHSTALPPLRGTRIAGASYCKARVRSSRRAGSGDYGLESPAFEQASHGHRLVASSPRPALAAATTNTHRGTGWPNKAPTRSGGRVAIAHHGGLRCRYPGACFHEASRSALTCKGHRD